jgi:hypothetical protein
MVLNGIGKERLISLVVDKMKGDNIDIILQVSPFYFLSIADYISSHCTLW